MTYRPPHANQGVSCRIAERLHALQQLMDASAIVPIACSCSLYKGSATEEEEGLQGVFKGLRRNGHQLEKGLQMAQRGPSLK
jgi:hypothetical protein